MRTSAIDRLAKIRRVLKRDPFIYRIVYKCRNRQQTREIYHEQNYYECRARSLGLPLGEEASEVIFERLRSRLEQRGISWPPRPKGRPLHILYASVPGNWERHNIPPQLAELGDVTCFFLHEQEIPLDRGWAAAREVLDQKLPAFVQALHAQKPVDFMLSYLSGSHISSSTIHAIGAMGIPTFSFHLDDRRSFRGMMCGGQWSGPAAVCRAYDLNLTNALASLVKYRVEEANVLFWPEGANPVFFCPHDLGFRYDVAFCGQRYGVRPILVDFLRRKGIRVDCFGQDWEHGYLKAEEQVEVFNQSRINLGFGFVNESSDQCLKARDFEVPSCGALYLTSDNENLHRVYRVGEEIETYAGFEDCARKVQALLVDPERCSQIRRAARQAIEERHSWKHRVLQLLHCVGVPQSNGGVPVAIARGNNSAPESLVRSMP